MKRTRLYRNGVLQAENFPPEDISEYIGDPTATVWLDMCTPTERDLHTISEELGLHELAVEDAVHEHQRPKLDRYEDHDFITAYSVRLDTGSGELWISELSAFVTDQALVTVRRSEDFDIDEVAARWDGAPELAKDGVGFLVHGLLDYVVDTHYDAAQALDDEIDDMEDSLFTQYPSHQSAQRRTLALRKSVALLRRVVLPMRDLVGALMRDKRISGSALAPYFQDVYDHVLRASEWTESLRDMLTNVRETQLNIQSHRLNVIMKRVTSWAAIIAVPTAITGFYGQNVPYPGLAQPWGFWASTVLIVLVSTGLYVLFKRRDWL